MSPLRPRWPGCWPSPATSADAMLDLAYDLEVKLPGTAAVFRDGILRQSKVAIIARATAVWIRPRRGRPSSWCWTGPGG